MSTIVLTFEVAMKPLLVVLAVAVVSAPQVASAELFINPFLTTTLTSPTGSGGSSKPGVGIAFGKAGTVGMETEIAYHPKVVDDATNGLAKSHVLTVSAALLVGPTIGRVRPYGALGGGDMVLNAESITKAPTPDGSSLSNNYFTVNVGGGVMGFVRPHIGIRGDLRYFRAYGIDFADLAADSLSLNHFNFWRANIGLALKF